MGNYKQLLSVAETVGSLTKRNKVSIVLDILRCYIVYGASPNNYVKFEFYHMNEREKRTYTTHRLSEKMIKVFNNNAYRDIFEDKVLFAEKFQKFFGRKYLPSKCSFREFEEFMTDKDKVIYKPNNAAQGKGIIVLHKKENIKDLYNEVSSWAEGIIEEWIEQHEVLSDIYPNAVNCLRIITVYNKNKLNILCGGVTFAVDTEIANGSVGKCLIAPVDMKTGIIVKPAASFKTSTFENHPYTNKRILGVQLPFWEEILSMLNEACQMVPEVRYVGWDIAITPTGPIFIEGNTAPGYTYYQIPAHVNKKGNRDVYEKALNGR